ncbi:MAG: flagellar export protein FliJ [Myxococcota bacterium]|nr:flagellar export protein FliJ [Myxococcota bacterium]
MKKFEFRLAAALMARNAHLELVQGELANVNSRLNLAEELLHKRDRLFQELAGQTPKSGTSFEPALALQHQRHLDQLREEIKRRTEIVRQLTEERNEAQDRVAEAYKDVRALEILQEKDKGKWLLEMKREEQKAADELNGQRHLKET